LGECTAEDKEAAEDKETGAWFQKWKHIGQGGGGDGEIRLTRMDVVNTYIEDMVDSESALKGVFFETGCIQEYYQCYVRPF
jgi:hypothetical protein